MVVWIYRNLLHLSRMCDFTLKQDLPLADVVDSDLPVFQLKQEDRRVYSRNLPHTHYPLRNNFDDIFWIRLRSVPQSERPYLGARRYKVPRYIVNPLHIRYLLLLALLLKRHDLFGVISAIKSHQSFCMEHKYHVLTWVPSHFETIHVLGSDICGIIRICDCLQFLPTVS